MNNIPTVKPESKKELYGFIGAFAVMVIAIIVVWQVFLTGKKEEELRNQKDTVIQTIVDTVKIKDSTLKTQSTINKETPKQETQHKDTSLSTRQKIAKDLTDEEKAKLKNLREKRKKIIKQKLKKDTQ
jgi:hypothetical protein